MEELVRSECVRVAKKDAEKVMKALKKLNLLRNDLKVKRSEADVLIPVKKCPSSMLGSGAAYTCCDDLFKVVRRYSSYKELLKGDMPDSLIALLPNSYDIIGDVLIIKLPSEVLPYSRVIGEALAKINKNVRAIYAAGPVDGEFRVRPLTLIYGERVEKTVYREYGIDIAVNVTKTYVNPSLAEEHRRIAEKVVEGEVVGDIFCGVGPFTLHIVTSKPRTIVYAVDKNPEAIRCLLDSLEINKRKVKGEVIAIAGDALKFFQAVKPRFFDRLVMNLPLQAVNYIPYGLEVLKPGGVLHVYTVAGNEEEALEGIKAVAGAGRIRNLEVTKVIDYAPHKYIYRVDVELMDSSGGSPPSPFSKDA